jgi:predicted MFS family arabinose efflux permease
LNNPPTKADRNWALALLVVVSTLAYVDRSILNTVGQAIKDELRISDLQLGLLGGATFALFYGVLGIPVARLAERRSRVAIISIAMAVWSGMTALCGLASSYVPLLLARIGVGVGEAGANAPSQSLVSDYFPPSQRASAIGILGLATPFGLVLGGVGGAFFAQHFGWRAAFLIVGLPGLLVAVIAWITIKEPPRGHSEGLTVSDEPPPLIEVVKRLWQSRTFRHLLFAAVLTNFMGYAITGFTHPYLVRAFGFSYTEAAIAFALINGIPVSGGYLMGGMVSDYLARRDIRFYGWYPAICMLISAPLYAFGFLQENWVAALVILTIPGFFSPTWYAPTYAITQNLVSPRMRASAVAILTVVMSLVGMAFGPVVTGGLSDHFAALAFQAHGDFAALCPAKAGLLAAPCHDASIEGLRWALVTVSALFLLAALQFAQAASHLKRELPSLR